MRYWGDKVFEKKMPPGKWSKKFQALFGVLEQMWNLGAIDYIFKLKKEIFWKSASAKGKDEFYKDINYYKIWDRSSSSLDNILDLFYSNKTIVTIDGIAYGYQNIEMALKPFSVLVNWYTGMQVFNDPSLVDQAPPGSLDESRFMFYVELLVDEGSGGGGPALDSALDAVFFGPEDNRADALGWLRFMIPGDVEIIEFNTPL